MKKPIPFGKYYLLERINVGGMAEVFRAKAFGVEGFERLVAVKRILPNIAEDRDFISMFVDEAKIAVQLNHANIAQVFDLGEEDGAYYIALEHVHGRDLRAIFDRGRNHGEPMPVAQACFVTMKVCEGLDYAHNKRDTSGRELHLVHRDVSPQNILVSFEGEVKIIDFGIAKAAGKGSKTQAGILKGKFGYMSPEQVRGLPIDRRSDVFSCGIVLYELLTGERLFVGESDFSTLEKVRNVEILPPSTYNRRIQPELERIVLKALAKDVEDRYQNAIDLHDELQAFVYTAGEFYSRKDLAAWMKKTFAREIEEETAKIESYRDMVPPPQESPGVPRPDPVRRAPTMSLSSGRKSVPPPIPGVARPSQAMAAVARPLSDSGLEWDEDELETSIYDDEPPPSITGMSTSMAGAQQVAADASGMPPSLATTAKGWEAPESPPTAPAEAPSRVADGSNKTKSPFDGTVSLATDGDPSAVMQLAAMAANPGAADQPIYAADFIGGEVVPTPRQSNNTLLYALIAASVLIAVGIVAVILVGSGDSEGEAVADTTSGETAETANAASDGKGDDDTQPAVATGSGASKDTGFDLIVDPAGVKVSLDGRPIGKAPLQIRNLTEGDHFVEIEAPAGFFGKSQKVVVQRGVAERVIIQLDAMDILGSFQSDPPGAQVSLVTDGVSADLGPTPVQSKLDPRKRYEVVFKKDGYATVTRPVEVGGTPELSISVRMEKASRPIAVVKDRVRDSEPEPEVRNPDVTVRTEPKVEAPVEDPPAPAAGGEGTLKIGAKPPCKIFVDGRDTGQMTPKELKLEAGRHKITLVNNEHGIKESFEVKIKADEVTKAIKNYTSQIAQ